MKNSGIVQLLPICGLANRMRAIDSAMSLSKHFGLKLTIYWEPYVYLFCPYNLLFDPIENVKIIELPSGTFHFLDTGTYNIYRPDIFYEYESSLLLDALTIAGIKDSTSFFNEIVPQNKNLTIESYSRFYPNESMYSWARPRKELLHLIEKETAGFDKNTIGVHIRRTDNIKSIENSPLKDFCLAMNFEIENNPSVNFFLASDCLRVRRFLVKRYGKRINTSCENMNRNTISGIQRALVELYSLSKTSKILGSYWSSFSSTAAHLGNIPLRIIVKGDVT